jgi:hypothetical protein
MNKSILNNYIFLIYFLFDKYCVFLSAHSTKGHTHCRTAAGSNKGCVSDKIKTLYFKYSGQFYVRLLHGKKETSFTSTVRVHNNILLFLSLLFI